MRSSKRLKPSSLAAFQVIITGRLWVITQAHSQYSGRYSSRVPLGWPKPMWLTQSGRLREALFVPRYLILLLLASCGAPPSGARAPEAAADGPGLTFWGEPTPRPYLIEGATVEGFSRRSVVSGDCYARLGDSLKRPTTSTIDRLCHGRTGNPAPFLCHGLAPLRFTLGN